MTPDLREKAFEDAIEATLLAGGPAGPETEEIVEPVVELGWAERFGTGVPGGYRRRTSKEYDKALCLLPRDVIAFVRATQPEEWERLREHHREEVEARFLRRLAREIDRRGTLDVLRKGVRDSGCKFALAYFRPPSGLNEEVRRLYQTNVFAVVRQLHFSDDAAKDSLDLAIFLNGLPLFTAELKNRLTGQTVAEARKQYRERVPREPLFAPGRCLAHFAVDPELVFVTTRLAGEPTRFLPFNRGKHGGAGNEPEMDGYPTDYLWREVWSRDSVLDLVQHFIHEVEEEDDRGRKTGARHVIFPRYHQLDAVRRLVRHAADHGAGQRYLIQHSAGSGKSYTIAWLAHQLSVLHDADDRRVFDSIVVVTDRRVLDRQLQRNVRQFEQTLGVVENIDLTSRQLKDALEAGKTIIVTTLQKFPVIVDDIGRLPGRRFAVIIDEAHSSQSGEGAHDLKRVLTAKSLEEAAEAEAAEPEDLEDRIAAEAARRGPQPNLSLFAFTATPKDKTLELFGQRRADGRFEAFSLYSMRQAIEEEFILDVLANYTTYKVYWRLLKTVADDPRYDREKASYLLRSFVDLHEHAIRKKAEIMIDHFAAHAAHRIGGRAKAMIVTRSRLHAVRYRLTVDRVLQERGHRFRALVAFSGQVRDPETGLDYTEAGMNGFPESQTRDAFERPENRLLIVAEKFQTGFDQPLLHTMYVDKRLRQVAAVQTLSRLNRTCPGKEETLVLDFANEAEEIREAFEPFYEATLLTEETDPNLPYDLQHELLGFGVYSEDEVDAFAAYWFGVDGRPSHQGVIARLAPFVARAEALAEDERDRFRRTLDRFVRLYAFLSQVVTFTDPDLEKLHALARPLRRLIRLDGGSLPAEVLEAIDMESYRVQRSRTGAVRLERGAGELSPRGEREAGAAAEREEPLSVILDELNRRFGTDFTPDDRVTLAHLEQRLDRDDALRAAVRVNPPDKARLSFQQAANDLLQEMAETNFKLYKRVADDREFSRYFLDRLFERYRDRAVAEPPRA